MKPIAVGDPIDIGYSSGVAVVALDVPSDTYDRRHFIAQNTDGAIFIPAYDDEGITWARGWDTPEANALRTAKALDPITFYLAPIAIY